MGTDGIRLLTRTLSVYEQRQGVIANNIANSQTHGFKADRIAAILQGDERAPRAESRVDLREGTIVDTANPLDVAIRGEGFFVVQDAGEEARIRAGNFTVSSEGLLSDVHHRPVLGQDGPILIDGTHVTIRTDGTVVVDGQIRDRLRIETSDAGAIRKTGEGVFASDAQWRAVATPVLRQGALEEANVDSVNTMVDMISAQRIHTDILQALRALDGTLEKTVNQIGKVS